MLGIAGIADAARQALNSGLLQWPVTFANKQFLPPASFSGCDIFGTAFVPGVVSASGTPSYKAFGELQTITTSSHRGVTPCRFLGESWVRSYVAGTRSFAGTMIFSVLYEDVFRELYSVNKAELSTPFTTTVDRLPPFTIVLTAVNEYGYSASMALYEVRLTDMGMTLSVDDILTESTYGYIATWATPFMSTTSLKLLSKATAGLQDDTPRASDLYGRPS